MGNTKLFKSMPAGERAIDPILVRFTIKEGAKVRSAANIRQLTYAEFIRRAALGKKADVRYGSEIVIALSRCTASFKALTTALRTHEIQPKNEAEMSTFVAQATEAVQAAIKAIRLVDDLR